MNAQARSISALPKGQGISIAQWAMAVISGLLLGLSQPKVDAWPLAWIAWVPLILAVRGASPKDTAKLAFVTHFVSFAIILYWIEVVVRVFGSVPFVIAWIPCALLVAYCAAWMTLAFWGARKIEIANPRVSSFWMLPFFVTAAEWARGNLFTGFPWGHPAYSQYKATWVLQLSDVTGIEGVLFVMVLASCGLAAIWEWRRSKQARVISGVAAAAILATLVYGAFRVGTVRADVAASTEGLKLGLVQGNIDQSQKWDRAFRDMTLERYTALTRKAAAEGAKLIFWPETAAPFYFEPEYQHEDSLRLVELAKETQTHLFFGAPAYGYVNGKERSYNRGYLLGPTGATQGQYDKSHLVPFSEYVPLPMIFGWIEKMIPVVGNFSGGLSRRALPMPFAKMGPLICYESIFPAEVRQFVYDGANFVAIITNDAWFLRTSAAYQHISMAVFRAVENRVPVVQAGNTGVTAMIEADGTIRHELPIFETATLVESVRFVKTGSLYARFGQAFAYVTLLGTLFFAIWGFSALRKPPQKVN